MLGSILSALAVSQMRASFRQARHQFVMSAIAALLLIVGVVFLLVAVFLGLVMVLPAVWVCVIFGVVFLVAGLIVLLFRRTARNRARPANAALYGALGGGATAAVVDDDRPAAPPRSKGWIPDGVAGKAAVALPLIAFVAAVIAGRRTR